MVDLLHEIWVEAGDDGAGLEGCCLAGPDGERFRRLLSPSARRTHTFTAGGGGPGRRAVDRPAVGHEHSAPRRQSAYHLPVRPHCWIASEAF